MRKQEGFQKKKECSLISCTQLQLEGCSGYSDEAHGVNITASSQSGLLQLSDIWVTPHKQYVTGDRVWFFFCGNFFQHLSPSQFCETPEWLCAFEKNIMRASIHKLVSSKSHFWVKQPFKSKVNLLKKGQKWEKIKDVNLVCGWSRLTTLVSSVHGAKSDGEEVQVTS